MDAKLGYNREKKGKENKLKANKVSWVVKMIFSIKLNLVI